jgi:LysR family hydrogen peroxide-inducible transcriptional activator|tara:strand:+ start:603 stop:1547 length:945 start_codon:yes stop_codon:yes gene_type:complete
MNFQQLEYVLAVHRTKHFGKAAESCNITQATLSAMIKKLEKELSILIFDRSHHPIQTTDEGNLLLKKAEDILAKQQELFQLCEMDTSEMVGEIRLGVIPTVANSLLALFLPSLLKQNPKLKLIISEITTDQILYQLSHNQLDFGILSTPIEDLSEAYEEQILYYEAMMVYGISNSEKGFVSSKDVENKKVWLLEEGHCFRSQSMTLCKIREKKEQSGNLQFKSNSFETLLNLSDQMGGLTLVPELYYNNLSSKRKSKTQFFQKPIPVREISLLAIKPISKKRSMQKLADLIQKIVQPQLKTAKFKNKDLNIIGI